MTVVASTTSPAAQLLENLGGAAGQVAATLAEHGITGERGQCGTCPIAVYLLRNLPGLTDVTVDGHITLWFNHDGVRHTETVPLTDAANDFVPLFDNGHFADLAVTR